MVGETILGYTIEEEIGSGGFGTVYKACKKNQSGTYTRAIKHISLPTKKQYNDVLNSMGGDYSKADNYFSEILKDIVGEIQILNNLTEQGVRNVVWYYENQIDESQSPLKYDIYILMEYLNPFDEYIQTHQLTVRDVIKLGKDIATALIACHKNNIIHRDIKDENIFVANDGSYKLGDFGVSKKLKDRSRAESMKGTPNYIAPEVYLGKGTYDNTVDIYSLGIVMYKLLNYNRNPFMPPYPEQFNTNDEDAAFEKRMKEEVPSLPQNADNALGKAVLKAISTRSERYNSAEEFFNELVEIEKSFTNAELNEVVIAANPAPATEKVDKVEKSHAGESVHQMKTVGVDYSMSTDDKKEKINENLFETIGDKYVPEEVSPEPERIVKETKAEAAQSKAAHNDGVNDSYNYSNTYQPRQKAPVPQYVAPVKKDSFTWLLYMTPVIIALIYIVAFFVLLPIAYDNTISFVDWAVKNPGELVDALQHSDTALPPVYTIWLIKALHYILSITFVVSLFFIGRKLHFSKPEYASNATLVDKEAYYLALEIYEEIKSEAIPGTDDVISAIKTVHDRLKNDSTFGVGNQNVIRCEQEIEHLLETIQSNITGLKRQDTFEASKQNILTACNRAMAKIKLRTELKKR
ncbi:MAG: serine/threonine protein kinase [Clostridia bacterium]|nr:serine/threonine protein kinase [Clostridia bacterium]